MATPDDDVPPQPAAPDVNQLITGLLSQASADPMAAYQSYMGQQDQGPPVKRGLTSLLGEMVAGGFGPGLTSAQQETAGNRALLNFGLNMLAGSGPSQVRRGFGQIMAQGLAGAQEGEQSFEQQIGNWQQAQFKNAAELQSMRLNALKEAIPLLQMQGRAGLPNYLAGGGAPPGGPVTGAATGATVPTDYTSAIGGHEGTGKNPNSSAFGTGQFLKSTWLNFAAANPELFPNMSEEQILAKRADPATGNLAINWLAQQNAGDLKAAGVTPSGQSLGIAHYLGAATAAKVMKADDSTPMSKLVPADALAANKELQTMTVGDMKKRYAGTPDPYFMGGPMPGGKGGTATAAAPPAAPAPYKEASLKPGPPPTPPAPAAMPRDQAIVQAAKTGQEVPITNPDGSPSGNVARPNGNIGAPSVAAAPSPQTTAGQASGPQPGTYEAYRLEHSWAPTPEETNSWGAPAAALAGNIADAEKVKRQAAADLQYAKTYGTSADIANATTAYNNANSNLARATAEAVSKGGEMAQNWYKNREDILQKNFAQDRQLAQDAQQKDLDRQNEIAKIQAQGRTQEETKAMEPLNTSYDEAQAALSQLELARTLSRSAGDPTFWQAIQQNHPETVKWLANLGIMGPDSVKQLGAADAMDAAFQKLISLARTGSGFQRMTNLDVQILTSQAPSGTDPQAWREAKLAYLQTYMAHQVRYVDAVRALRADGVPLYEAQRRANADVGSNDVVPQVPNFTDGPQGTAAEQREKWAQGRLFPNQFVMMPDGQLRVYQPGGARTQQQQPPPPPGPKVPF